MTENFSLNRKFLNSAKCNSRSILASRFLAISNIDTLLSIPTKFTSRSINASKTRPVPHPSSSTLPE